MRFLNLIFIASILCAGCATGYHREGFSGGYKDSQIGENTFDVDFDGNGFTSMGQAKDFALLRAAELTLKNGCSYFTIIYANSENRDFSYKDADTSYTTISGYGNHYYSHTTYDEGMTHRVHKPECRLTVETFKERPNSEDFQGEMKKIYDAGSVQKIIKHRYGMR